MTAWIYSTEEGYGDRKCEFVACPDCQRKAMQGRDKFLAHRKYGCSFAKEQPPRSFFFPEEKEQDTAAIDVVANREIGAAEIDAAAKRGDLRAYLSDDEIRSAVRCKLVSMDDAMNQDF